MAAARCRFVDSARLGEVQRAEITSSSHQSPSHQSSSRSRLGTGRADWGEQA